MYLLCTSIEVHLFLTSLELFSQELKLKDEREYLYFTVWWKGPGSISDFACSDPATAVSFKLIRKIPQLYKKQQYKTTIKSQNTAEKSSLLSLQLHFLKLFVQTENADESHSRSSKYWKINKRLQTSIYIELYLEFWISYSNFILYLHYHRTF